MSDLIVEVCKISEINTHPNADRLDIAKVKGFQCIVPRGEYTAGDLVVFIPPDCILPEELIVKHGLEYVRSSGRTTTVKLRGVESHGIILTNENNWPEGKDVARILNITKWQPPPPKYQSFSGGSRKKFNVKTNSKFVKYTSLNELRALPNRFKDKDVVVITEKIHGTNARFGWLPTEWKPTLWNKLKYFLGLIDDWEFCIGSHNIQIAAYTRKETETEAFGNSVYEKIAKKYVHVARNYYGLIFFGEIYGQGIQDLTYGVKGEPEFVCFDIYSAATHSFLDYSCMRNICEANNIPMAPLLYEGKYDRKMVDLLVSGNSCIEGANHIREGIVIRADSYYDDCYGRKVLKYRSLDYLTRKNGTEYQ